MAASPRFEGPWGGFEAALPLVGRHNLQNALQAISAAVHLGVPVDRIIERLQCCPCPPGRLQMVPGSREDSPVFIDFAHTDEALRSTLSSPGRSCHPTVNWRCCLAVGVIATARNGPGWPPPPWLSPITSSSPATIRGRRIPDRIISDITAELTPDERQRVTIEPDRREAIKQAVSRAGCTQHDVAHCRKGARAGAADR